jgi:hypothetical protein
VVLAPLIISGMRYANSFYSRSFAKTLILAVLLVIAIANDCTYSPVADGNGNETLVKTNQCSTFLRVIVTNLHFHIPRRLSLTSSEWKANEQKLLPASPQGKRIKSNAFIKFSKRTAKIG